MNEYTFLMLDDIPVTIWCDGTVDIHVPNTKSSGTVFGLGWNKYQTFKGKLIGSWHSFTVANPKIGQEVRLYNIDTKHTSLPVVVHAVYHNGNPMSEINLWKMVEEYPNIIGFNRGFTSLGEEAIYSVTIARLLELMLNKKNDVVDEKSLVNVSIVDNQTLNIHKIIDDLERARVIYRDNGKIIANTALYHILKQAINRMNIMREKPYSNTD